MGGGGKFWLRSKASSVNFGSHVDFLEFLGQDCPNLGAFCCKRPVLFCPSAPSAGPKQLPDNFLEFLIQGAQILTDFALKLPFFLSIFGEKASLGFRFGG